MINVTLKMALPCLIWLSNSWQGKLSEHNFYFSYLNVSLKYKSGTSNARCAFLVVESPLYNLRLYIIVVEETVFLED